MNRHPEAARHPYPPRLPEQQFTFAFARPCAHRRTTRRWRPMRHGGLHLGEHCTECGRWLRWVPQRAAALGHAPPRPRP